MSPAQAFGLGADLILRLVGYQEGPRANRAQRAKEQTRDLRCLARNWESDWGARAPRSSVMLPEWLTTSRNAWSGVPSGSKMGKSSPFDYGSEQGHRALTSHVTSQPPPFTGSHVPFLTTLPVQKLRAWLWVDLGQENLARLQSPGTPTCERLPGWHSHQRGHPPHIPHAFPSSAPHGRPRFVLR
jgi:hypothetical protein